MPPAELPRYELGDRSYLREKVVTTYEALWRGEDIGPQGWTELFFLKVNAAWIQTNIATMPTDKLRPVARRLFAECRVRLGAQHDPAVQCHALETLSGFFLGLGCRSFRDFGSDVIHLLCSIEEAEAQFGGVVADLKRVLQGGTGEKLAAPLQRAAVRLLLCMASAAETLDQNILIEFVLLHDLAPALRALVLRGGDAGTDSELREEEMREDALRLLVLLGCYQRHEVRNGFRSLLEELMAEDKALPSLLQAARRIFSRALYPEGATAASSYLGSYVSHTLLRAVSWTAHALTIEDYLPSSLSSQLSGPHALAQHASRLAAAMLLCWELVTPQGGAAFVRVCEADPARASGGAAGGRAELLRLLLSTSSLLACDVREALPAQLLLLAFRLAEGLAEGAATSPLLLQIDLGAGLPMWRLQLGRLEETSLAGPQPLLAALYTLLGDFMSGNLRRAGMQVEAYAEGVTLLQRLLHLQQRSGQTLPLLRWAGVWEGLLSTATFIATDEMFGVVGVPELGLRILQVLNQLVAMGDSIFPTAAVFESFAYELVRSHRTFERLYKLGRKQAPQLVSALKLTRSLIVQALDALPQVEGAAGKMSASEAMAAVRKLQLEVPAEAKQAVARPPPPHSPQEQAIFRQQLLRILLAKARTDGSAAPLPFEDLSKGVLAAP